MNSLVRFTTENGGKDYNILFPNHFLYGYYSSGNPTCAFIHNKLTLNSRLVNYKKILQSEYADFIADQKNQTYYLNEYGFNSRNIVCELHDGEPSNFTELDYGEGDLTAFYRGFEDCRFIVWDNKLYTYGTRWDKIPGIGSICIYELDTNLTPLNEIVVKSPTNSFCEKNWGAIEDKPFCFVYKTNETLVVKVFPNGDCSFIHVGEVDERYSTDIKGSTPVIRYNEHEYISIVHRTTYSIINELEKSTYQTAFVFYDNNLNITRMSEWFVFRTELCEFSCGLCIVDGIMYLPYSQIDCTVNMLEIPIQKIEDFLKGGIWPEYGRDYIYELAKIHEQNEQYFTGSVLFNYAAILSKDNDNEKKESVIKTFAGLISEFDSIKSNTHINRLISCIKKAKDIFNDCHELDYLLSIVYRFDGNIEAAKHVIEQIEDKRFNITPDFQNYVNIDYL